MARLNLSTRNIKLIGLYMRNHHISLQHAHNPVDWFAWGATSLSKRRGRKINLFLAKRNFIITQNYTQTLGYS